VAISLVPLRLPGVIEMYSYAGGDDHDPLPLLIASAVLDELLREVAQRLVRGRRRIASGDADAGRDRDPLGADLEGRRRNRGLLDLGRTLGVETVAEGVEDEAQRDGLRSEHCDFAQGYLFAKPLEPVAAEQLLAGTSASVPASTVVREPVAAGD
jgi:hypothetical protein